MSHHKKITTMTTTDNKDFTVLDTNIHIVDYINGSSGTFRAIVKTKAGFMTSVSMKKWENIYDVFCAFNKGALQTIEFIPEGYEISLTVFAMKGKKCLIMDKELAEMITVGDVNNAWMSTNLYSPEQYKAVNASSWISKVFVVND